VPEVSIDDRAQLKADGIIHTLKIALGKHVQNHVAAMPWRIYS